MTSLVLGSSGEEVIQKVLADALSEPKTSAATRSLLLDLLAKVHAESVPTSWVDALGKSLNHEDVAVRRQTLETIKTRNMGQLDQQLNALARDSKQSADLRIAALECLSRRQPKLDAEAFALLAGAACGNHGTFAVPRRGPHDGGQHSHRRAVDRTGRHVATGQHDAPPSTPSGVCQSS